MPLAVAPPPLGRAPHQRAATTLLLGGFGVLSLVTSLQFYLSARFSGEPQHVGLMLLFGAASWGVWALAVPPIIWLGRRFDFSRGRRALSCVVHAAGAVACHGANTVFVVWLGVTMFQPTEAVTSKMIWSALAGGSRLSLGLLAYAGIVTVERTVRLWQVAAERETHAARSEAQASRARLHALSARLHPHFLFNALQSVSALIDQDPARARTMIAQIGDLLRDVLGAAADGDVPLREEVALLGRYLAIEELRFADRVRVQIDVAPDVEAVPVPRLLLQPLAENALRHGLARLPDGGTLQVLARRTGDRIRIAIRNDGNLYPAVVTEGIGLSLTRERLMVRYGPTATFALRALERGVEAVLEIPA